MVRSVDVGEEQTLVQAFDEGEACFGPIDTVYANAGMGSRAPAMAVKVEEVERIVRTNILGTLLTAARRRAAHDRRRVHR